MIVIGTIVAVNRPDCTSQSAGKSDCYKLFDSDGAGAVARERQFDSVNGRRKLSPQRITACLRAKRGKSSGTGIVVGRVFPDAPSQRALMYRIVPEATYKRRRERLSPAERERTERLARVIAMAEEVWQDREQTRRFLTTPHSEIGGKTPIDAAFQKQRATWPHGTTGRRCQELGRRRMRSPRAFQQQRTNWPRHTARVGVADSSGAARRGPRALTEPGARQAEEIMARIFYGFPA